jgi:hypothetical protein
MVEFRNESGLVFQDISSEQSRTYDFGIAGTMTIDGPVALNVSESGGHRIFDATGTAHYIPPRWIALRWQVREGAPHFSF